MTVRKGEEWGSLGELDQNWPTFADDRSAAVYLAERVGCPPVSGIGSPTIRLSGGDLFRSLGSPTSTGKSVRIVPVDVLSVTHDRGADVAVAHVVVRRSFWQGDFLVAMNATHVGALDLGPRSHPNDAVVDLTEGSLGTRERIVARRRARSGAHLPHPQLRTSRVPMMSRSFDRPMPLYCDGRRIGVTRALRIEVLPDAFRVAI